METGSEPVQNHQAETEPCGCRRGQRGQSDGERRSQNQEDADQFVPLINMAESGTTLNNIATRSLALPSAPSDGANGVAGLACGICVSLG